MLIVGLSNEVGLSLNPLLYLPMMFGCFYIDPTFFILGIAVPAVAGFLGFYTANHAIKHLAGTDDATEEEGMIELQMVKAKQIVFEV